MYNFNYFHIFYVLIRNIYSSHSSNNLYINECSNEMNALSTQSVHSMNTYSFPLKYNDFNQLKIPQHQVTLPSFNIFHKPVQDCIEIFQCNKSIINDDILTKKIAYDIEYNSKRNTLIDFLSVDSNNLVQNKYNMDINKIDVCNSVDITQKFKQNHNFIKERTRYANSNDLNFKKEIYTCIKINERNDFSTYNNSYIHAQKKEAYPIEKKNNFYNNEGNKFFDYTSNESTLYIGLDPVNNKKSCEIGFNQTIPVHTTNLFTPLHVEANNTPSYYIVNNKEQMNELLNPSMQHLISMNTKNTNSDIHTHENKQLNVYVKEKSTSMYKNCKKNIATDSETVIHSQALDTNFMQKCDNELKPTNPKNKRKKSTIKNSKKSTSITTYENIDLLKKSYIGNNLQLDNKLNILNSTMYNARHKRKLRNHLRGKIIKKRKNNLLKLRNKITCLEEFHRDNSCIIKESTTDLNQICNSNEIDKKAVEIKSVENEYYYKTKCNHINDNFHNNAYYSSTEIKTLKNTKNDLKKKFNMIFRYQIRDMNLILCEKCEMYALDDFNNILLLKCDRCDFNHINENADIFKMKLIIIQHKFINAIVLKIFAFNLVKNKN